MIISLTQSELQALLASAYNQLEDLKELKAKKELSVGWKIMFDDFENSVHKLEEQYKEQLKYVKYLKSENIHTERFEN